MPTRQMTYLPSYPVETQEEYRARIKECRPVESLPWKERPGCKRHDHVMLSGGRGAARYAEDVPTMGAKTVRSRKTYSPPYAAKSQSLTLRRKMEERRRGKTPLSEKIAEAIEKVRSSQPRGDLGFQVPQSIWVLIEAGMPRDVAILLVKRAGGKLFPMIDPTHFFAEDLFSVLSTTLGGLKIEEIELLRSSLSESVPLSQLQVSGRPEKGFILIIRAIAKDNKVFDLVTAEQIEAAYRLYRQEVTEARRETKGGYRKKEDDPNFFSLLFGALDKRLDSIAAKSGDNEVTLEIDFSLAEEPVYIPYAAGEHSKFDKSSQPLDKDAYRHLSDVTLQELPELLARLSHRKSRRGRYSDPLNARRNPSMVDRSDFSVTSDTEALTQLVFEKAYPVSGVAPELVPVPGKPGKVYWPVTKEVVRAGNKSRVPLGIKEVSEGQAKSWLVIAETGRVTRSESREAAKSLYQDAGMSRDTPPQLPIPVKENPMFSDDDYWLRQYQQGPFGASRSIPTARRNASKTKKPRTAAQKAATAAEKARRKEIKKAHARSIAERAHQILRERDCSWQEAISSAWSEAKGGRSNPRVSHGSSPYLEQSYQYEKTRARTAAQLEKSAKRRAAGRKSGTAKEMRAREEAARVFSRAHEIFNERPECDLGEAMQLAWKEIGKPSFKKNPGHSALDVKINKFNPALECCVCGQHIEKGEEMAVHPHMQGPRGGKKYCHPHCV